MVSGLTPEGCVGKVKFTSRAVVLLSCAGGKVIFTSRALGFINRKVKFAVSRGLVTFERLELTFPSRLGTVD